MADGLDDTSEACFRARGAVGAADLLRVCLSFVLEFRTLRFALLAPDAIMGRETDLGGFAKTGILDSLEPSEKRETRERALETTDLDRLDALACFSPICVD